MIFLDCEASSLTGYPIEIGFARVMPDRSIVSAAKLIRHDEWLDNVGLWGWQAEAIHKITRANLMEFGRPVAEVAAWLNAELAGRIVLIDSPKDQIWVDQLMAAAGMVRDFTFADVVDTVRAGPEVDREVFAKLIWDIGGRRPHRGDADAKLWAEAYLGALKPDQSVRQLRMPWAWSCAMVEPQKQGNQIITLSLTRYPSGGGSVTLLGRDGRRSVGTATGERTLGQLVGKAVMEMLAPPKKEPEG